MTVSPFDQAAGQPVASIAEERDLEADHRAGLHDTDSDDTDCALCQDARTEAEEVDAELEEAMAFFDASLERAGL
jgi:hypothetical protein